MAGYGFEGSGRLFLCIGRQMELAASCSAILQMLETLVLFLSVSPASASCTFSITSGPLHPTHQHSSNRRVRIIDRICTMVNAYIHVLACVRMRVHVCRRICTCMLGFVRVCLCILVFACFFACMHRVYCRLILHSLRALEGAVFIDWLRGIATLGVNGRRVRLKWFCDQCGLACVGRFPQLVYRVYMFVCVQCFGVCPHN